MNRFVKAVEQAKKALLDSFEFTALVDEAIDKYDLVEVVHCRECKHWNPNGIGICKLHDIRPTPLMMDDFFCADGERKEQDDG